MNALLTRITMTILAIAICSIQAFAQVTVCIEIANEHVDSGYYHFDLYLTTGPSSTGDLNLGNADFRLYFTGSNFTAPVLTNATNPSPQFGIQNGFCTLAPTSTSLFDSLVLQRSYYDNTALSISGDELVLNLNGPTPSTQSAFNTSVAIIDGTSSTHRLGRFQVSGYNGGGAGLSLKTTGALKTVVFTLANDAVGPPAFESSEITQECAVLPVEFAEFTASRQADGSVRLDWQTFQEINNDYFEIEKQREGGEFEALARVAGAGTTYETQTYRYYDQTKMAKVNYYRLRQVDLDGSFTYSNVVQVNMEETLEVTVYPNPANTFVTVKIDGQRPQAPTMEFFDGAGRMVYATALKANSYETVLPLPKTLPSGIYHYRVRTADRLHTGRLTVVR